MGRSKMIDEALIAAIAKRLGWTRLQVRHHIGDTPVMWAVKKGHNPEDLEAIPPDWLTSVDAALGVLDTLRLEYSVGKLKNGLCWCEVSREGITYLRQHEPTIPRAILLAVLEAK